MHKDQWGHNYNTPGEPLSDVLGFEMIRNRTLPSSSATVHAKLGEEIIDCLPFLETVAPTSASVEATFTDGPAEGCPAALINQFKKGCVYYATACSVRLVDHLVRKATKRAGIDCYQPLGDRVAIFPDLLGDGIWLFNHSSAPVDAQDLQIPAGEYTKLPCNDSSINRYS
jgi:hypothetical protein